MNDFPARITMFIAGKKASDMEITKIELLDKIDDHLFDKP
jgi:hypothetical protein